MTDVSAWQPIATAPRNGIRIRICQVTLQRMLYEVPHHEAYWHTDRMVWMVLANHKTREYVELRGESPTHWEPLEDPPAVATKEAQ